jgi:hypothetical protein
MFYNNFYVKQVALNTYVFHAKCGNFILVINERYYKNDLSIHFHNPV